MATKPSKSASAELKAVPKSPVKAAKTAAKGAKAAPPKIQIVAALPEAPAPEQAKADGLKMKELIEAVVEKSGVKKKDVKEVVEATLAAIAGALGAGKALSLPPLGNLRVVKSAEKDGATTLSLKLRMGGGKSGKQPLAEDGEDS